MGWLAYELGHIIDYRKRSSFALVFVGLKYILSGLHVKKAERAAAVFAIGAHLEHYIAKTKEYILGHAKLSQAYKAKIKELYLGPEEIMKIARGRGKKKLRSGTVS